MGKVKDNKTKDGAPAKPAKSAASPPKAGKRGASPFFANLLRTDVFKPNQGKRARLLTAIGLGVILAVGLWRLFDMLDAYRPPTRYGIPAVIGLVFGWAIFRILHYPPFAEFLIATEAEMNKVSWTTRADLIRATTVVLATVILVTVFLFAVDRVWSWLLQLLRVLEFGSSDLGQTG